MKPLFNAVGVFLFLAVTVALLAFFAHLVVIVALWGWSVL